MFSGIDAGRGKCVCSQFQLGRLWSVLRLEVGMSEPVKRRNLEILHLDCKSLENVSFLCLEIIKKKLPFITVFFQNISLFRYPYRLLACKHFLKYQYAVPKKFNVNLLSDSMVLKMSELSNFSQL